MTTGLDIRVVSEAEFATCSAEIIQSVILEGQMANKKTNLCLPTGDTPRYVYDRLVQMVKALDLSSSGVEVFTLDEWGDLPPMHPIRCISRLEKTLLGPVGIASEQVHFLEPNSFDIAQMCAQYDNTIRLAGGLSLSVLGIGMNGHVGFNEPGSTATSRTRRVELEHVTLEVSKRYGLEKTPTWGVTVGISTLMESDRVLLLANGAHKAPVIKRLVEGPVTAQFPASYFKNHSNCTIVLDEAAAAQLVNVPLIDRK